MIERIKRRVSTKILDIVDSLPQFRRGTISRLQNIRNRQRKWSTKHYEGRKAPENSNVEINRINLVLTFEHEDFENIQKGMKKYFPKNENIEKFRQTLTKSKDNLYASSWHNLGYITRTREGYIPGLQVDESLPSDINYVSLSYHRILPSVACIIFEFSISESVSKRLKILQDQEYLDPVIFKKFWPINKLHRSYSMGGSIGQGQVVLSKEKDIIRKKIERWILDGFGWNARNMEAVSYIDVYKITGNPKETEKCKKWIVKNSQWLNDFNISTRGFDTYIAKDFIFSNNLNTEREYIISSVITQFESDTETNIEDFSECKVGAIAISSTLFSLLRKHQNKVEKLRAKGFRNLYKGNMLALKKPVNIQELKKLVVIISRLQHEIEQSGHWVTHSMAGIDDLHDLFKGEKFNLSKHTIDNVKYQINQLKSAAELIDNGLTNYLSIQSIYVMYKLQRWMFVLSIVVTIATIVGVLSGWDNLKTLVTSWTNA